MSAVSRAHKNTQAMSASMPLPPVQNPLSNFPSKNDSLSKPFFGVDLPKHKKKVISKNRWLDPERVDPKFGVQGSDQEDFIRRSYRRIGSSVLFSTPSHNSTSLGELMNPVQSKHKNYVVVEESQFAELNRFENVLREEKEKLGEQCAWVLSDVEISARIPVPATRMAIHNLCESEMKKCAHDIMELSHQWNIYRKQNHLDKPHQFSSSTYLESTPLAHRGLKLKLVKEASRNWHLKMNRDSMSYEDDISYLTGKYLDAQERKKDYDRYYVLATRYGYYTEEEYNACEAPGKWYWATALNGALKFQGLWGRYWTVRKLLRYKSSIMIQNCFRLHSAWKKFHLIIVFRVKVGKRSYYRFCLQLWREYLHLVAAMRDTIKYMRGRYVRLCYSNWATWARESRARKDLIMKRFVMRIKMAPVVMTFDAWKKWVKKNLWVKLRTRRLMQNPHFALWVDYTRKSKEYKYIFKKASKCQAIVRCWYGSRRWKRQYMAIQMLHVFGAIVLSLYRVNRIRNAVVEEEFLEWNPGNLEDRILKANDGERRRLQKLNLQSSNREKAEMIELRKHLKSGHGNIQLKEHAKYLKSSGVNIKGSSKEFAEKDLLEKCTNIVRCIERHDFNSKTAPFVKCADVGCHTVCTSEDQYHSHLLSSPYHIGNHSMQFSHFHLLLRNPGGQAKAREYLLRTESSDIINCLDCWNAIQEWRKISTKAANGSTFSAKVMNIYDLYICTDAALPLGFTKESFPNFQLLVENFNVYKNKEYAGFYYPARAEISYIRKQLGFPGKEYTKWGTENVFSPDCVDELEWKCFLKVFNAIRDKEGDGKTVGQNVLTQFEASPEGKAYSDMVVAEAAYKREQLVGEYRDFRMHNIVEWAFQYKKHDMEHFHKATEVTTIVTDQEIEFLLNEVVMPKVDEATFEGMYEEQSYHEALNALTEEAFFWIEDELLDEVFDYYTRALLKSMWEIPECKKGMMQYAELAVRPVKKKLLINMDKKMESKALLDQFLNDDAAPVPGDEKDVEKKKAVTECSAPLDAAKAATRIQTRFRGVLGRKSVRKLFVTVFVKRWDKQYNTAYYVNIHTNETSWERPKMMKNLFPKSTW